MQIEIFLYIYGAICASMIGFNIAYALLLRGSELRLRRRTVRLKRGFSARWSGLRGARPWGSGPSGG